MGYDPNWRDQMAELSEKYPQDMLSIKQVMDILGKSENTCVNIFGKYMHKGSRDVSKMIVAKYMVRAL